MSYHLFVYLIYKLDNLCSTKGISVLAEPKKINPALVLNADFRPLSYFPLSVLSWQETVKAVITKRVNVVSEYDQVVRSPSIVFRLPSVISLKKYVPPVRHPAFTRFNLFLRDRFSCQYCGIALPSHELTFDHVIPRSHGGRTMWNNVVTACSPCNIRKGGQTPNAARMKLKRIPKQPSVWHMLENGRMFPPNFLHDSWHDYLYWDTELVDN